jgi:flagellar biogenesis protein FliO
MNTPELAETVIRIFGALALVLAAFFLVVYLGRRFVGGSYLRPRKQRIRVLESCPIGIKKQIALVEVAGVLLAVGITRDHIGLLYRLGAADEETDAVVDRAMPEPGSFGSHLHGMISKWTDKLPERP